MFYGVFPGWFIFYLPEKESNLYCCTNKKLQINFSNFEGAAKFKKTVPKNYRNLKWNNAFETCGVANVLYVTNIGLEKQVFLEMKGFFVLHITEIENCFMYT